MDTEKLLRFTIATAHAAGARVRDAFGRTHQVAFKGEVNLVTEVDTAAESLIISRIRERFPTHQILAEEEGGDSGQSAAPLWLIDPLDGTNNFAHNFPHIAISIALWVEKEPLIGVIYDPLRDETFAARQGHGATCNGRPIHTSPQRHLAEALLGTGFPYNRRVALDNNTQRLDHFLRRCQGVRRAGAAALDLAYVACGRLDGFWEPDLKPWDVAAGILLIEEAGGRITDFADERLPLQGEQIVASNGYLHQAMLRIIREGANAPHPDRQPEPAS